MMRFISMLFVFLMTQVVVWAQTDVKLVELSNGLQKASSSVQKVNAYFALSDYYFLKNRNTSDSLAFLAQSIAEASRDRSLMVNAHLKDATRFLKGGVSKANLDKALAKTEKALALSKQTKEPELLVACYNLFARVYRNAGDLEKAVKANNEAIVLLPEVKNDSVKISAYSGLGKSLQLKGDMLNAFKAFLNASTIAEQNGKASLIISVNHNLEQFYLDIDNFEKAKDYAFRTLKEDEKAKDKKSLMQDYYNIAGIYVGEKDIEMAEFYFSKSEMLADSLQSKDHKIVVKLGLVNMYLNNDQFKLGYDILKNNPLIFDFLRNSGMQYELDKANGHIQMMLGNYDSSLYYYKKAEPYYMASGTPYQVHQFYTQYSMLFQTLKKWDKAIEYQEKARRSIESTGYLEALDATVEELDSLYYYNNDFKGAYKYQMLHQQYSDSLRKLSEQKGILSLEIDNENKRAERAELLEEEILVRRHNLQYMGITAAIAGVFILLVALGLFKVSARVVKATGFFAFIFLFEFIILILDNQIHHLTHGEPWKILLIKIVLIAMLLPFHHWLEEKVIHYLIENRLLLNKKLEWLKVKKTSATEE